MTTTPGSDQMIFQIFNEIAIINQLSSAQFAKALAPHLGQSEFAVLNHFVRVRDGTTPSRLARIFQMSKPSMTAILAKLQAKGLIEIAANQLDRRGKIVTITPAGREARARGVAAIEPLARVVSQGVDIAELAAILPTLTALRAFLDSARNQEDDLQG